MPICTLRDLFIAVNVPPAHTGCEKIPIEMISV